MIEEQQDMFKKEVTVFTSGWCTNCKPVKHYLSLLEQEGVVSVEYADVDALTASQQSLKEQHNILSIPVVVYGDKTLIGSKTKQEIMTFLEV